MAEATLDSPLTIDPQQAAKLVIRASHVDHDRRVVLIHYDMVSAGGVVVAQRSVTASGGAVQTWITNQEATIYGRLLASLGVTGTVG